jgi:hypothetical protein
MAESADIDKVLKKRIDAILGDEFVEQYLFDERVIPRKCTRAEKELRKKAIRRMVVAGFSYKDVAEYCRHRFEIGPKQVEKYLGEIYSEFKRLAERDIQEAYGLQISRLEKALVDCEIDNDMNNRVKVLKELSDMQGLKKFAVDLTSGGDRITLIVDGSFLPKHDRPEQHPEPAA